MSSRLSTVLWIRTDASVTALQQALQPLPVELRSNDNGFVHVLYDLDHWQGGVERGAHLRIVEAVRAQLTRAGIAFVPAIGTYVHAESLPTTSPLQILIVDNGVAESRMLSDSLRLHGNVVNTVHDSSLATRKVSERATDAVLLNLGPSLSDVADACHALRATPQGERIALVAINGHEHENLCGSLLDAFLARSVAPSELHRRLHRLVARRRQSLSVADAL